MYHRKSPAFRLSHSCLLHVRVNDFLRRRRYIRVSCQQFRSSISMDFCCTKLLLLVIGLNVTSDKSIIVVLRKPLLCAGKDQLFKENI